MRTRPNRNPRRFWKHPRAPLGFGGGHPANLIRYLASIRPPERAIARIARPFGGSKRLVERPAILEP